MKKEEFVKMCTGKNQGGGTSALTQWDYTSGEYVDITFRIFMNTDIKNKFNNYTEHNLTENHEYYDCAVNLYKLIGIIDG